MKKEEDIVKIFTGSTITVNILKEELEEAGIPSLVKNDFDTGIVAGFAGGIPNLADLYVNESDKKRAEPFVKEISRVNK